MILLNTQHEGCCYSNSNTIRNDQRIPWDSALLSADQESAVLPADQESAVVPLTRNQLLLTADQESAVVPADQESAVVAS